MGRKHRSRSICSTQTHTHTHTHSHIAWSEIPVKVKTAPGFVGSSGRNASHQPGQASDPRNPDGDGAHHNAVTRRCHGRSRRPWQIGRHLLLPHHPEAAGAVVVSDSDRSRTGLRSREFHFQGQLLRPRHPRPPPIPLPPSATAMASPLASTAAFMAPLGPVRPPCPSASACHCNYSTLDPILGSSESEI